ncbi:hypothetical protein B0H13DRAFT_1872490 [Mycena leptocephala]|nr:hypothetical protein B0H13DRAFT_1872490 [Mycena leptocephala]
MYVPERLCLSCFPLAFSWAQRMVTGTGQPGGFAGRVGPGMGTGYNFSGPETLGYTAAVNGTPKLLVLNLPGKPDPINSDNPCSGDLMIGPFINLVLVDMYDDPFHSSQFLTTRQRNLAIQHNFQSDNFGECNFGKRQLRKVATPKSRNFELQMEGPQLTSPLALSTVPLDVLELYFLPLKWDIDIRLGPTSFSLLLDVKDDLWEYSRGH